MHNYQKTYEEIMESFDFERVRALMLVNNWTWRGYAGNPATVPTIELMKATVASCFDALMERPDRNHNRVGTGGFLWRKYTWDSGSVELELTFAWESKCYSVEVV